MTTKGSPPSSPRCSHHPHQASPLPHSPAASKNLNQSSASGGAHRILWLPPASNLSISSLVSPLAFAYKTYGATSIRGDTSSRRAMSTHLDEAQTSRRIRRSGKRVHIVSNTSHETHIAWPVRPSRSEVESAQLGTFVRRPGRFPRISISVLECRNS
mgnify:CR=1 FL=1